MKIISVINYKGGVGKTTLTANLAAALARKGKRVLLLDMDAQCSLTLSLLDLEEWASKFRATKTIKNWFDRLETGEAPIALTDLIIHPQAVNEKLSEEGCLDLISSHLGLINIDLELATQLGGASLAQSKRNFLRTHRHLCNGLESVRKTARYDLVLIDCPPNFNITTKNALIASDMILVPSKPDHLSTLGIEYLSGSVKSLINDHNDFARAENDLTTPNINPSILGVVFTMVGVYGGKPIGAYQKYIDRINGLPDLPRFDNYFRENKTAFGLASETLVPFVLGPHKDDSQRTAATEIRALADEFATRAGI